MRTVRALGRRRGGGSDVWQDQPRVGRARPIPGVRGNRPEGGTHWAAAMFPLVWMLRVLGFFVTPSHLPLTKFHAYFELSNEY